MTNAARVNSDATGQRIPNDCTGAQFFVLGRTRMINTGGNGISTFTNGALDKNNRARSVTTTMSKFQYDKHAAAAAEISSTA